MKPSQAAAALALYIDANQPVFMHGSPGGGKSAINAQDAARRENWGFIDMRLSQMDSVDLRGIPYRDSGYTRWAANAQLPHLEIHGPYGTLFLDEMNAAAKSTMAAAYQLVLDRRLGDYVMPPGWRIVAAGNLVSDRSIVESMPMALRNRFAHIMYETDHEDWCTWAIESDLPLEVLGFIRFRPNLLDDFAQALSSTTKEKKPGSKFNDLMAFATPRSWAFVAKMLQKGVPSDIEYDVYAGIVGDGPAAEFLGYLKHHRNMPNLDMLLMNPDKAPIPEEPAVLYALATGLAAKSTEDNFDRVIKYLMRIQPEFQVLTVKDAAMRNNALCSTKAFNVWSIANANVLI